MKIADAVKILDAQVIALSEPEREIEDGYCGDLLSYVMGKAPENCAWFTIMNNVNVAAVAALTDVSVVVLCEGVMPDESLLNKLKSQQLNMIVTGCTVYEAVRKLG